MTFTSTARRAAAGYAALSVANIVLGDTGVRVGEWITKPLLMPALALFVWVTARSGTGDRPDLRLPIAGILLGGAGDAALSGSGLWFIAGMACFAAGHCCYLTAMRRRGAFTHVRRATVAAYAVIWLALVATIWSGVGGLLIPVIAYSLLLVAMAIGASGLPAPGAAGGALFVVSDGFIALGLAGVHLFPHQSAVVMPTYVAAQFLLALAWLGGFGKVRPLVSRSRPDSGIDRSTSVP
ncbi:lysoplasmalogenase [Nocardia stercoris]|nr:lysoplasmalogenase [Nocardia stercoris]